MQVKDAVVLVTGANRGIGAALVQAFQVAGAAKIYAAARSVDSIKTDGVVPLQLDVTQPADILAAAAACGDVTIVVNNAGIMLSGSTLADDVEQTFLSQVEVNVLGPLRMTRAFAPILKRNGGGAVVNVHSVLSWLTISGSAAYSASKAAVWAFTNGIRSELASQNTQVLGLHMGFVDTDMTAGIDVPKVSPADVATQVVESLEDGDLEVLADGTTRTVKVSLGSARAAYLYPPDQG
ncbi:SDR family oxidoreductase [Solimonas marina]|uniref:SDR family oxidoreductase n=1 Tax=Solimonas marina TaxID=2714601 RepID=A0A969WBH4_9GAMM|nr:SDR family oxidoreductase [Solimonas marina]NKF23050.1 SDR family oxidoreductase [Solimonas marina]